MKTAMQELIEWIENGNETSFYVLRDKAKKLLKKEKNQIIDAYNFGQQIPPFDYAEQYYNQTYNQNRITISEIKKSIEGIGLNNQKK